MNRKNTMQMLVNIVSDNTEKEIYMYMFDTVTRDSIMNEKFGNLFLEKLSEDLKSTSDLNEKAFYLEIMIRILYDLYCCDISVDYNICGLYEMYCEILSAGYMDRERVPETLKYFRDLNIDMGQMIDEMIGILGTNLAVRIFLRFHMDRADYRLMKHDKFLHKIECYRKRTRRFDVVLHFHLLVTTEYMDNIEIAGEYLKRYTDYSLVCADWIFSSKVPNCRYVEEGIISVDEHKIFLEAGDILEECRAIEVKDESYEGLLQDLKTISENFRDRMRSGYGEDILKRFDKGKSFLQVACLLP